MAFEARPRELLDELSRLPYPPLEAGHVDQAVQIEAEKKALTQAIQAYSDARARRLERLYQVIRDARPDRLCAPDWFLGVQDARDDLGRLSGALKDVRPAPSNIGLAFVQRTVDAETKFYDYVARAKDAADSCDYLVRYRKTVEEKTQALDAKWSELMSQHGSFYTDQRATVDDLERTMLEAAQKAASDNASIKERMMGAVEIGAKTVDFSNVLPGEWGALANAIASGAEWWNNTRGQFSARLERYRASFRQERGTLLVIFKDFHADAEEFVSKYGYQKALDSFETGRRALAEIRSSGSATSGLASDADTLGSTCTALLEKMRNDAKDMWDAFVRKHEKKFFGPVGPDIDQALTASAEFKARYEKIKGANLAELLSSWLNQTRDYWGVDLGPLSDQARSLLKNALRESMQKMIDAEEAAKKAVSPDVLYDQLFKDREEAERDLPR